jgi:hypothetical protein
VRGDPTLLLTSVPAVVTVATVAVAFLFWDLLQRELGPSPSSSSDMAKWKLLVRPLARSCRTWGLLATGIFVVLMAMRFVVLGA